MTGRRSRTLAKWTSRIVLAGVVLGGVVVVLIAWVAR
jgi:hypothetical protein